MALPAGEPAVAIKPFGGNAINNNNNGIDKSDKMRAWYRSRAKSAGSDIGATTTGDSVTKVKVVFRLKNPFPNQAAAGAHLAKRLIVGNNSSAGDNNNNTNTNSGDESVFVRIRETAAGSSSSSSSSAAAREIALSPTKTGDVFMAQAEFATGANFDYQYVLKTSGRATRNSKPHERQTKWVKRRHTTNADTALDDDTFTLEDFSLLNHHHHHHPPTSMQTPNKRRHSNEMMPL
jgi:hypothetical protein